MTHPNFQTNGASLEDCHTNFFALTELSGIKWRKLVYNEAGGGGAGPGHCGGGEPLDDPVLRSYARCLDADILCVWRRVPTPRPPADMYEPSPPPPLPLSLSTSKELWIFWYGEEPDLNTYIASELNTPDCEQGSLESDLTYECRSLLFKAVHNLIERCLLSRDFIRLGKWFVQPYEGPKKSSDYSLNHLSFSFAFFVHGEKSVCVSVDVRQHPPVRRLARFHLQQAQSSVSGLKVILAPFGLAGTLTGQTFRSPDVTTRFLEDWSYFYPLDKSSSLNDSSVVEVVVGGVKMKYPSCYVFVTDLDDNENSSILTGASGANTKTESNSPVIQTPPPSPVQINSRVPQPGPNTVSMEHPASMSREENVATVLPERVWQECVLGGPPQASNPPHEFTGQWEFVDPVKRANCTCSKCRKYVGSMAGNKWSSGTNPKTTNTPRSSKAVRGRVPFHRRSPVPADSDRCAGSYTPHGGPPSYPRTQESVAIPSVGSPPSVAPSPLPNPHSQPASVPPGDPTMPLLSPHPATVLPSPVEKTHTPDQPPKSSESGGDSTPGPVDSKVDQQSSVASVAIFQRPILSVKEYEATLGEDEQSLDMLYDYTTLDAWLNHPVKKFKPDCKDNKNNNRIGKTDIYSLYNNVTLNNNEIPNKIPFIKQEIKQEAETECQMPPQNHQPHGIKRPGDPYEFDEEGGGATIDGFKRGGQPCVKEEPKDLKKINTGNLFTSEGLQPSYKDLDQIFDNSDDTSSDEAMQVQTPPGSTTLNHSEDGKRMSGHGGPTMGILRPEELSKMFPTPPSLEHNPIASPCGQLDLPLPDYTDFGNVRIKQEIYPNMGSPQEENIEDWSYVFKPPIVYKMVGSSKYAPLTNLPSQGLPPVTLPPHCVYKPSWVHHHHADKPIQAPQSAQSVLQNSGGVLHHQNPFPPSPLHGGGFRQPPPPYELPSPATSTASSYLNKNLNSVEAAPTPTVQRTTPEASSLALNVLLTDTASNIFRDHNFNSCTLCVCNEGVGVVGNIKGADAGVYLINSSCDKSSYGGVQQPNSPFTGASCGLGQPPPPPPPYGGMLSPTHHPHQMLGGGDEDNIKCQCGFSAVVNRRLAHGSGLFYEDEMEITGMAEDPAEKKKSSLASYLTSTSTVKFDPNIDRDQIDVLPPGLLELVREQCVVIPSTASALCRAARHLRAKPPTFNNSIHVLEYSDCNDITSIALEQSRHSYETATLCGNKYEEQNQKHGKNNAFAVHRWPFLRAGGPQCNQDVIRVMKSLQPLLQEAIQKKCQTRLWEAPFAVKGPLTWRQFHQLAGRGTDYRCEPQPIPAVVVGHDKDWLSLSPYAIQHWESLLLEPYSFPRDVAYIVVAPDNDAILPRVRTFFKELSTAYEMCKLGRHSPITKVLRDGILRVGKTAKMKIGNEPVEEWFTLLGEGETTDMLKLYAQVCKHHLAPHLQQVPMDRTLLDPPETNDKPAPSPMPPPSTPDGGSQGMGGEKAPNTPKSEQDGDGLKESAPHMTPVTESSHDDDEREAPSVVVYLVEPFSFGSDQPELHRLACLALLRCFQSVLAAVPENIRNNISVQIISLESIVELGRARDRLRHSDHMRALSLNIFSQCRRLLLHSNNVKSLTGFGTAAMADQFLKSKDDKNRAAYRLYTPPYILAPMREKAEAAESFGKANQDQASVLYLSYCLSEDQSWLLAVATDERGEIFESVTINIDIPNRSRRKKASARRIGLEKLMNFVLGVMSQSARPWRLVVGRLGRIGHGELKGWSWLLSKKNLLEASKHLKDVCNQCNIMYPNSVPCILSACLVSLEPDTVLRKSRARGLQTAQNVCNQCNIMYPNSVPCILSACLVSLEPDTVLRLMPDQFTPDERWGQVSANSQLSTPQDVSCTHILVFPTSAKTQSSQNAFQEQHITSELEDRDLFPINDDEDMPLDGLNLTDLFTWNEPGMMRGQSPTASPRREESSGPGSPGFGVSNGRHGSPFHYGSLSNLKGAEAAEEVGTLLQQPLALGYYVSTAPTGKMPKWFWASCPHLEGVCPAFLKNSLHLHNPNIQQSTDTDEELQQPTAAQQAVVSSHPLDSHLTTDVLRYVLEGYNALSWLALDSNTNDRLSCLPAHMQVLVQLYHTAAALL